MMPVNIPLDGTLSYGAFSFGGAVEIEASFRPVRDDSERAVIYVEHTLRVRGVITADPEHINPPSRRTDLTLESLRRRLTRDGKRLVATGLGIGDDLDVNGPTGVRDVKFGPKPKMLSWKPIAGAAAAEIEWEVVTCIPMCSATARYTGLMALAYTVAYAYDESGDCTRTITGYLEIALTRLPGENPPADSADAYWESIVVAAPLGFSRTHTRTLSQDRRRLDFVITDKQIESNDAYPPHVVRISGSHDVGVTMSNMNTLDASIDMSITLAPGRSGVVAWNAFHVIAAQRIQHARIQHPKSVFLDSVRIREGLYSRTHTFSISYRILTSLDNIVTATGLWTPLPGSADWPQWRVSLADSMFAHRGTTNLHHPLAADAIITLCEVGPSLAYDAQGSLPGNPGAGQAGTYENEKPDPDKSYYEFEAWIRPERATPHSQHSPVQDPDAEDGDGDAYSENFEFSNQSASASESIIQVSGARLYRYRLHGFAVRVGYPVPRIRLTEIGGEPAKEARARFQNQKVGKMYGVDVYRGAWDITYLLAREPAGVIEAPTPATIPEQ